jgi:hypothetical protein
MNPMRKTVAFVAATQNLMKMKTSIEEEYAVQRPKIDNRTDPTKKVLCRPNLDKMFVKIYFYIFYKATIYKLPNQMVYHQIFN